MKNGHNNTNLTTDQTLDEKEINTTKESGGNKIFLMDVLSESWDLYTRHFKVILIIIICVYVPVNFILNLLPFEAATIEDAVYEFIIYSRIAQILQLLLGTLATMAIAFYVRDLKEGKNSDFSNIMRSSFKRWPNALWSNLIAGFFLFFLFILFIIPGIIYSIYWVFITVSVILDNKSGMEALNYSKSLVQNKWWQVCKFLAIFILISAFIGFALSSILFIVPNIFILNIISDTFIDIGLSFITVCMVIYYLKLINHKKDFASAK